MDKFKKLVERVGIGIASRIKDGNIPKNLQKDLTAKDWEIINQCTTSSDLKKLSEEKMKELP